MKNVFFYLPHSGQTFQKSFPELEKANPNPNPNPFLAEGAIIALFML
jgi:hypothetical protein